jgi:glutamate-1-semialdehyde aminotransferase
MSNGYPMAAVIGRPAIMDAANQTFISSTSWSERIGPAAALSTIHKFMKMDLSSHLISIGKKMKEVWTDECDRTGIPYHITGIDPLCHLEIGDEKVGTLLTQGMLDRGILAGPNFYPTAAHSQKHIDRYQNALREVLSGISTDQLRGPVRQRGFSRMT